jgi:hypothetical protein
MGSWREKGEINSSCSTEKVFLSYGVLIVIVLDFYFKWKAAYFIGFYLCLNTTAPSSCILVSWWTRDVIETMPFLHVEEQDWTVVCLITYCWLTPWSRVLLQKPLVIQLVKFPAFYGTWMFITVFTILPLVPIPSQIHPIHTLTPCFFKNMFNIINTNCCKHFLVTFVVLSRLFYKEHSPAWFPTIVLLR